MTSTRARTVISCLLKLLQTTSPCNCLSSSCHCLRATWQLHGVALSYSYTRPVRGRRSPRQTSQKHVLARQGCWQTASRLVLSSRDKVGFSPRP
ncbi:hypothetical protein GE09DRAFT_463683 [Coniochaeta sp. 2T2.1]|nr:hypothetical protein GE09DRAFT_463683 [Coniochaeta sp. 2T2.1]